MALSERTSAPSEYVETNLRSPSHRDTAGPMAIATPGLRSWVLIASLVAAVAASCSEGVPIVQPQAVSAMPEAPEIRTVATASVLITARPEQVTPTIESVQISPSAIVVDPGEIMQLSAQAFGSDGQPLSDVEFVWAAADPRAGSISEDGSYQGGTTPGVFENSITVTGIQNTLQGTRWETAFASITVVGEAHTPTLANVAIIPEEPSLFEKQIFRLRAVGFDKDGMLIPGVRFVWKLRDPTLGRINELGYLTVHGDEGTFEQAVAVTGLWEGGRSSASIDVRVVSAPEADDFVNVHALPQRFYLDPGDRLQLRAVALNGLGELVAGTQLRWEMEDATAGTIDGNGNFVAGDEPGIYTRSVKVEAVVPGERGFVRAVDFASVVIREEQSSKRLRAISVRPGSVLLAPGGRATLAARAVDESGEPAEGGSIAWEVLRPEVGSISDLGAFKAGNTPGSYPDALRVTVEQRLGDETITRTRSVKVIITGTLSTAAIHPALAVVAPGKTVHFSLTGLDENSVKLPGLVVLWRVADVSVGSIDAFGNFTAGEASGLYEGAIIAEVIQTIPYLR